MLYDLDSVRPVKAVPKWTSDHISLPRGKKMKVSLACQMFSHSAACAMRLYIQEGELPPEASDTANFLEKVNSMWDFVDSHSLSSPPGKKAVSASGFQEDMLRFDDFSAFVESWIFIRRSKPVTLSSHKGWLLSLKALKSLCIELIRDQKLNHLCLRKCNQDHVENMHSRIRGYNGFNDHPMVDAYVSAIRCLSCSFSTTELLDQAGSTGANCQPDGEAALVDPDSCPPEIQLPQPENVQLTQCEPPGGADVTGVQSQGIEASIVSYIAGYVVRKLRKGGSQCPHCMHLLLGVSYASHHALVELKDFTGNALVKVSDGALKLCMAFEQHYQNSTKGCIPLPHPRAMITESFKCHADEYALNCCECHGQELVMRFIRHYATCRIFHSIKMFNAELKKKVKGAELNKDKKLNM